MKNLYLLRHAYTQIDNSCPPCKWALSTEGDNQARKLVPLILKSIYTKIDKIICSEEKKTLQTVKPISEALGLTPIQDFHFNELNSHLMPEPDYQNFLENKRRTFSQLDAYPLDKKSTNYMETAREGLNRFLEGIESLHEENLAENILLCSHGTIITLYFGYLEKNLGKSELLFEKWRNLGFCTLIIIQNSKIIGSIPLI